MFKGKGVIDGITSEAEDTNMNGSVDYGTNYSYNTRGQMTGAVTDSKVISYTYDAIGRRSGKTVNGTSTNQYWDGSNIVRETGANNAIYYRGVNIIAQRAGTDLSYYLRDAHGDTIGLAESTGGVMKGYKHDAFGSLAYEYGTGAETPFRYNGQYTDDETGLIYLRNRYYDPSIGRFTQEDPAQDGLNWYVYCGNDPVNMVDNFGTVAYELFSSPDAAAEDWAWNYYAKTDFSRYEQLSIIYKLTDGENTYYTYGSAVDIIDVGGTNPHYIVPSAADKFNLILLGEDTFASGNKYTIDNSLLVFQDAASFCCIENYMDNDSVYVIDQSDRLYAMGSNRHGQLGFEDISALNEFRLLDEDVIKIDGVENQMYYLKNNGDLYAWGNYGGSNIPTKYLMNISDFSGGNILICIDNNGTIYKYRNDKIVDTLSGPEVKKVSVSLGITALLTKDGRVLLSGEENHNGIIPTNKMSVDFKKPVVLQENTIFNLYVFLFKYGFAIIGLLIILLLISGEYINKSAVTVGYSHTAPTPKFEQTLKDNGFVFEVFFARDLPAPKAKREREKTHKYVCPICGQEVKSTADLNLICGECEVPMERLD